MYNSSYAKSNMGWTAKKMAKSQEKSCGYYMKIIFFFSSLIQSLIIVSLVLFLVYGQPEYTAAEKRVQELEQNYGKVTMENLALRATKKNLTQLLNVTLTAKKVVDKDLGALRKLTNTSNFNINALNSRWRQCEMDRRTVMNPPCPPNYCSDGRSALLLKQSEEMLKLVRANFSEKMTTMGLDLQNAKKEKLTFHLESIELRRDKAYLEERIKTYENMCKQDFVQSLQGIPEVTKEFLKKVNDLFMKHDTFQLTCEKQGKKLEEIGANCSSLSREVENKLQTYLDRVGSRVAAIVGANAEYITENKRLKEDSTWCKRNHSAMIEDNQKSLKQVQLKHDQAMEQLLLQVRRLTGNERLQADLLSVKDIEIKMLTENMKVLNASLNSCKSLPKSPYGQFPGGSSTSYNWPNLGSSGTRLSTGLAGSSFGNVGSNGVVPGRPSLVGGTGTTGFINTGSSGQALARTGFTAVGTNAAGSPPFGGAMSQSDAQFTAQLNNHLRELQRYAKTD